MAPNDAKSTMQKIKRKIATLLNRNLQPKTITISIIIAALISLIAYFSGILILFSGNADSARYLLSALSQSMAAIFALFFTVPLIALQMAASKYGSKMYDLFFDKNTLISMLFFITIVFYPFLILSRINELGGESLSIANASLINIALIITAGGLLYLIPYALEIKNKLKPDTLLNSLTEEVRDLIERGNPAEANKRVDIVWSIATGAIRENDTHTFKICLDSWTNMLTIERPSWVQHVLTNRLPKLFAIASDQNEMLAKDGINALEVTILGYVYRGDKRKAVECTKQIDLICSSLSKHPEVVKYANVILRGIGQQSIIEEKHKDREIYEVAVEAIRALRDIASSNKEAAANAAWEIRNIIAQALGGTIEEPEFRAVEEGVKALASIGGYGLDEVTIMYEAPEELKKEINEYISSIIFDISIPYAEKTSTDAKMRIAKLVLPCIVVADMNQSQNLIILGAQIYGAGEGGKEVADDIIKKLKESDLVILASLGYSYDKVESLEELKKEFYLPVYPGFKKFIIDSFEQAKSYLKNIKFDVRLDSFEKYVSEKISKIEG